MRQTHVWRRALARPYTAETHPDTKATTVSLMVTLWPLLWRLLVTYSQHQYIFHLCGASNTMHANTGLFQSPCSTRIADNLYAAKDVQWIVSDF